MPWDILQDSFLCPWGKPANHSFQACFRSIKRFLILLDLQGSKANLQTSLWENLKNFFPFPGSALQHRLHFFLKDNIPSQLRVDEIFRISLHFHISFIYHSNLDRRSLCVRAIWSIPFFLLCKHLLPISFVSFFMICAY